MFPLAYNTGRNVCGPQLARYADRRGQSMTNDRDLSEPDDLDQAEAI